MPPPAKPEIEGPDERGIAVLSGHAVPESQVYAENESTGFIYGQRTNAVTGAYRFPIAASIGDIISMYYRLNEDESTALVFEIRPKTSHPTAGAGGAAAGSTASAAAGTNERGGAAELPSAAGAP